MSERAVKCIKQSRVQSFYFNLKDALLDGERGQTPFTPAVGILRQINVRLREIKASGGVESEIKRIRELAYDFRCKIKDLPFKFASHSPANAVAS